MIESFADQGTEDLFNGLRTKAALKVCPVSLRGAAIRKLDMLEAAVTLIDLRVPPGNKLEKLKGDLVDYYSIRINDQVRIVLYGTQIEQQMWQ